MLNLACHYTDISACSYLGEGQTDTFDAVTAMLTGVADEILGVQRLVLQLIVLPLTLSIPLAMSNSHQGHLIHTVSCV